MTLQKAGDYYMGFIQMEQSPSKGARKLIRNRIVEMNRICYATFSTCVLRFGLKAGKEGLLFMGLA